MDFWTFLPLKETIATINFWLAGMTRTAAARVFLNMNNNRGSQGLRAFDGAQNNSGNGFGAF